MSILCGWQLSTNEIFDTAIVVMTVLFVLGVFYNFRTKQYFRI